MTTEIQSASVTRILRLPELRQRIGLANTAIYARLDPDSKYFDATFPRPVPLGSSERVRATGWVEAEVEEWLRQQIERRAKRLQPMARAEVSS